MQTINGTIKLIDSSSGFAICESTNLTPKRYFFFNTSECNFKAKEEHSVGFLEDDEEPSMSFNNNTTNISKAKDIVQL